MSIPNLLISWVFKVPGILPRNPGVFSLLIVKREKEPLSNKNIEED